MNFHTTSFLIFFLIFIFLYWIINEKGAQNYLLFAGSIFFVSFINIWFGVALIVSITVNFLFSLKIADSKKKYWLLGGIVFNVTVLIFFKYTNFFLENFNRVFLDPTQYVTALNILLPLGLSFYTFSNIGYLVDTFRNKKLYTKDIIEFGIFVSFFPKLVSGPIEKAAKLIPQIQSERKFPKDTLGNAVLLFMWGLFKKLVISNNLLLTIAKIFALKVVPLPLILLGSFLFAIQLYADFSGYSDMAVAIARLLGFKITQNFNFPYISKSPSEFWKRWHISLSTWVRDYIYIPLGGSRVNRNRTYINLIIALAISGAWHGASWNYLIWGIYWGLLLVIERIIRRFLPPKSSSLQKLLGVTVTFVLATFGWLIFYENNLTYLLKYVETFFIRPTEIEWQIAKYLLIYNITYILPIPYYYLIHRYSLPSLTKYPTLKYYLKHLVIALLIAGIAIFSISVNEDFIYAQF